jgi:hypothetical protein
MSKQLIDGCFYVEEKKWGTWDSYDQDGKCIITSLTEEECVRATRFFLKGRQEGFDNFVERTYTSTVDGKL